ncbi:carbohydrate kinase family protein [Brevibacterium siliguriense]|nr:carbohydrate kinase [Brevibacterium siliguriense]
MSILVIGEALIDIVSTPGSPDRYAPGGAPANVALGLGRLGVEVEFLTDVGDDFHGGFLLAHLQKSQVAVLASPRGATSTALARLADDGSAEYEFHLRWDPDASLLSDAPRSVVHFGSIAAFLSPGAAVIDEVLASATGASGTHPRPLISFDPNIRPSIIGSREDALPRFEELASRVDVLKLSDVDANWLYPDLDESAQVNRLLSLGANLVAMTLGGEGAIVATASALASVTSRKVEVKDTIGAGDTFMVSLIHDLNAQDNAVSDLCTAELTALGDRASALAAITVSQEGADLPWAADLTS